VLQDVSLRRGNKLRAVQRFGAVLGVDCLHVPLNRPQGWQREALKASQYGLSAEWRCGRRMRAQNGANLGP
jgi:hypothetical protein